jgi:hypothetical protein
MAFKTTSYCTFIITYHNYIIITHFSIIFSLFPRDVAYALKTFGRGRNNIFTMLLLVLRKGNRNKSLNDKESKERYKIIIHSKMTPR